MHQQTPADYGLSKRHWPEAGSDAASVRTSAIRDGDSYRIRGAKRCITNAPRATVFTVMARTDPAVKGAAGISAFIVPANTLGISLGKLDHKMGQRGALTCDVVFDDCVVPASAVIGGVPGKGFATAMKVLDRGRIHIGAVALGMSERLIGMSLRYAQERRQFNQLIASFQLVQALLADSRTDALASQGLVEGAARRFDAGEPVGLEAAVGRIADRAVQIHGGAGYMSEYKVERLNRDVRLLRIYGGTSKIQQLIIAREMLRRAQA